VRRSPTVVIGSCRDRPNRSRAGHDQGVASGDERQARGELRPVGVPAGFLFGEDPPQNVRRE
jgi:hypothetical protein